MSMANFVFSFKLQADAVEQNADMDPAVNRSMYLLHVIGKQSHSNPTAVTLLARINVKESTQKTCQDAARHLIEFPI